MTLIIIGVVIVVLAAIGACLNVALSIRSDAYFENWSVSLMALCAAVEVFGFGLIAIGLIRVLA